MQRPRALDLFCGAGGATVGLQRAGFHVTGVDIVRPSSAYPGDDFIQCDLRRPGALSVVMAGFDFAWASPPCQKHTAMRTMHNARPHEDLIPQARFLLEGRGLGGWVIENVEGAPLRDPIMLCGTMFGAVGGSFELQRHRLFECSWPATAPGPCQHWLPVLGVYGGHIRDRRRRAGSHARGREDPPLALAQRLMGIDWMTLGDMSEAIPPVYSEYLARQWLAVSRRATSAEIKEIKETAS